MTSCGIKKQLPQKNYRALELFLLGVWQRVFAHGFEEPTFGCRVEEVFFLLTLHFERNKT